MPATLSLQQWMEFLMPDLYLVQFSFIYHLISRNGQDAGKIPWCVVIWILNQSSRALAALEVQNKLILRTSVKKYLKNKADMKAKTSFTYWYFTAQLWMTSQQIQCLTYFWINHFSVRCFWKLLHLSYESWINSAQPFDTEDFKLTGKLGRHKPSSQLEELGQ